MARNKDKNSYENLLLVEGATEKRAIPELVEANGIIWEISPKKPVVFIDDYAGGDTKIVKPAVMSNELKVLEMPVLILFLIYRMIFQQEVWFTIQSRKMINL